MRVMFAAPGPHWPDFVGGAERDIHTLLTLLRSRGHECEAVVGCTYGPYRRLFDLLHRASGARLSSLTHHRSGYATHRTLTVTFDTAFRRRVDAFRPDVVVTHQAKAPIVARLAESCGLPVIWRIQDLSEPNLQAYKEAARLVVAPVANSRFVATRLEAVFNRPLPVIYPLVTGPASARPRIFSSGHVTFVNPIPVKGVDIVLAVADLLPRRRFTFVQAWRMSEERRERLHADVRKHPNVRLVPPTLRMDRIYRATSVLIAPSQCEEAFGLVNAEANAFAIPVVASRVGGVPEALGDAGVLLERDTPARDWASAVESILASDERYSDLSRKALASAARPEIGADRIAECFVSLARGLVEQPCR
jgi:glycosyltransferase involved in cell wall biosynthesis